MFHPAVLSRRCSAWASMSAGSLYDLVTRSGQACSAEGVKSTHSPSGVASPSGYVAPFCPCVDDVGLDAEPGGDLGDRELLLAGAGGLVLRCWWAELAARSRQACSTSGGKGMHQRPAGPRRAARSPDLIQ
jgi:hypothetical protein